MKKLLLTFLISTQALSCPNGLDISESIFIEEGEGNVTQEEFIKITTELEELYRKDFANRGGRINVVKDWENTTVNAYATRESGKWNVLMFGGLARHKTMTADGFALIVCHEIGHHVGGEPRYDGMDNGWATGEGQSDYFAVMKCLRRYWERENNHAAISGQDIPQKLSTECSKNWNNSSDYALCVRAGLAGQSAAHLFSSLAWSWKKPKFETPDNKEVKKTILYHPKPQCRLDTYLQGSLCEVSHLVEMRKESEGNCHESLGHKIGLRPACWYKPTN